MYFENLNASDLAVGQDINMTVTVNGYQNPSFKVTDSAVMKDYHVIQAGMTMDLQLTSSSLQFPTFLNALEIYEENLFDVAIIDPDDGETIRALKTSFNLSYWQGDPCTPASYDGLTCVFSSENPTWFVTSITLSNLSGSGSGFSYLQNNYNSSIFQNALTLFDTMSLTKSDINDSNFVFLVDNFLGNDKELKSIDLSYNSIKQIPAAMYWKGSSFTFFNLSHNTLVGEVPAFGAFGNALTHPQLTELNLSYNAFTSLPTTWAKTFYLEVLDLSHNNLRGEISSLDLLVQNCSSRLQELYISDNYLTGQFNSSLYLSSSTNTNLSIGDFSRNQIQGTLNLSIWLASLQNTSGPVTGQTFLFLHNNITGITPNAQAFEETIDNLLGDKQQNFNRTGVFLGGNPYCKGAKTKTELYLCRYTNQDPYDVVPGKDKTPAIIGGVIGGFLALLVFFVMLGTIAKLWRKVYTLQKIQQVLTDQKVHPPLFAYNDLKVATKNFHNSNELGKGSFGIVYKGLLADGTTLGVKKLKNSQRLQVLNEFLNEVVLITGIKHRNLVHLKGCCIEDKQRILVYEYVENGNLAEALWGEQTNGILNWQQRLNICLGIARGLSYLHDELQPRIIHRDIKPANILLDKNLNPKIADFGLARHFLDEQSRAQSTQLAGTMGYWAPEYAIQGQLTDKADVFSFGTLTLEILSGRKCIDKTRPPEEVFLRDWAVKLYNDGKSMELLQPEVRQSCVEADFIRVFNIALLSIEHDPRKRATMSQVVTMLSESMDVTTLLGMCHEKLPNYSISNLLPNYDDYSLKSNSTPLDCGVISEELSDDEYPLVNVESSLHFSSLSSRTITLSNEMTLISRT